MSAVPTRAVRPRRRRRWQCRAAAALLLIGTLAWPAAAQSPADAPRKALSKLSIEELLEITVGLPTRRDDRMFDAPTAISLLTSEDIRRSGAVSLPETLRFMPGVFAARTSAAAWVVTTRGFAMTTANKLQVMIDGRTVFSPLFSGVLWDTHDAVLSDLERIEVVRGPGAALWGSNAVNGVVNVVSKSARDTPGALLTIGAGGEERVFGAARYGGRLGDGAFRVYAKFLERDDARVDGAPALDRHRAGLGGFRLDVGPAANGLTLQGGLGLSRVGPGGQADIESMDGHVLGRWIRQFSPRTELRLQAYYDRTTRLVPRQFDESRNTFDVDVQQRVALTARQTLIVGGGYRISADDTTPTELLFFVPEDRTTDLGGVFAQHELRLTPQLTTTVGAKIEGNDFTGGEFQPAVRARWAATPSQMVWGAVSRAVRLPTRLESDIRVRPEGRLTIVGNPGFGSEQLVAFEAGSRTALGRRVSLDATVFHNRYDDLRSQEAVPDEPVRVGNGLNARSSGVELIATGRPQSWSRVLAAYAYLDTALRLDPDSLDATGGRGEAVDPEHQLWLQGRFDLPRRIELDVSMRRVSALRAAAVPAYTEVGFRLGWRPSPAVDLSLVGRDLLHDVHLEFASPTALRRTALERAIHTRLTLRF